MSELIEAYRSLSMAKDKQEKLRVKGKRVTEIYNFLRQYCNGYEFYYTRVKNVNDIMESVKERRRESFGLIAFATLLYLIGIGMLDFIFLLSSEGFLMLPISIIVGLVTYIPSTHSSFVDFKDSQMEITELESIIETLDNDPRYKNKRLDKVLELLQQDREEIKTLLSDLNETIKEYEHNLDNVNEDLASAILSDNDIEASITINSTMKVLSKRYEEK